MQAVSIPNISVQEKDSYSRYIELISRINIPEHLKRKLLSLAEIVQFSNLTKEEIKSIWLSFSADIDLIKMSLFRDELDDQTIIDLEELKNLFYIMLKRSEQGFERKMQVSQYHYTTAEQQIQQQTEGGQQKGFFRKLFRI